MQSNAAKTGDWGAHCQGLTTGGQWGKEEKDLQINIFELKAVTLAIMTFTRLKAAKNHSHKNGKYSSTYVRTENGGDEKLGSESKSPGSLSISIKKRDHNYCRVSSNFAECLIGLRVTSCPGPQQRETEPKIIQKN